MTFDCVIPVAGASSRMGSFKPLLPWKGWTVVESVVAAALAAGPSRVILVTGHRGAELASLFDGEPRVLPVENPGWEAGMLGSIQAGLAYVDSSRFFVTPADMPLIGAADYARILGAAEREPGASAWFPEFDAELGHPVLISSSLLPSILALPPSGRLRPLLLASGASKVPFSTRAVLEDLDRPEDYARLSPFASGEDGRAR